MSFKVEFDKKGTAMRDLQRETARIYEFPKRARVGAVTPREPAKPVGELALRRVPRTAFGSGWYHEAAIEEAERERKQ